MFRLTGVCFFILLYSGIVCHGLKDSDAVVDETIQRYKRNTRPVTCVDRFAVIPGHTMCLDDVKTDHTNASVRQEIVNRHNLIRGSVDPPAADMLEMQYFISLEREAKIWADQCKMVHDGNYQRYQPGRFLVGQNIAISPKAMTWNEVIDLWASENQTFQYGASTNSFLAVGHYTQLVWSKTVLVGCGMSKCDDSYMYVCNYAPSGNQGPINMPYVKSQSGSSCDSCSTNCNTTAKLCDCTGKFCLNEGTLNLTTCECQCNTQVNHYEPSICELVCEDKPDNPLCGIPPFDKASCATNTAALMNCPALCNVCPYAGANYTEGSVPLPADNTASSVILNVATVILVGVLCLLNL